MRSFSDYYGGSLEVSRARETKKAPLADAILETLLSPAVPLAIKAAAIDVRTFPEGATVNDVTDLRRALSAKYGDILDRLESRKSQRAGSSCPGIPGAPDFLGHADTKGWPAASRACCEQVDKKRDHWAAIRVRDGPVCSQYGMVFSLQKV
jgi:hypothetical protein